jgi:hypothetical protein
MPQASREDTIPVPPPTMSGDDGDNVLIGDPGVNDVIYGGRGSDFLFGGGGGAQDILVGGSGRDVFAMASEVGPALQIVFDFQRGKDKFGIFDTIGNGDAHMDHVTRGDVLLPGAELTFVKAGGLIGDPFDGSSWLQPGTDAIEAGYQSLFVVQLSEAEGGVDASLIYLFHSNDGDANVTSDEVVLLGAVLGRVTAHDFDLAPALPPI